MIPLRDRNPTSSTPVITVALVVVNVLCFFYELSLGEFGLQQLVFTFGMVPARVVVFPTAVHISFGDAFMPLFTSMFLHGGWLHLLGNMWFLWIFGDNIEDRLGHFRFLLFYLLVGLGAGLVHTLFNLTSTLPAIGASGAVSGVMGAYLILFPGSRVLTLIPAFFLFTVELPAFVMILYWFFIQLVSGWATTLMPVAQRGGVAWWAHVGGFLVGIGLLYVFRPRQRKRVFYQPW